MNIYESSCKLLSGTDASKDAIDNAGLTTAKKSYSTETARIFADPATPLTTSVLRTTSKS
jgi:hypothetical protein